MADAQGDSYHSHTIRGPTHGPTHGPTLYKGTWPAWRTAADYRENAFSRWLEFRCQEYGYTLSALARAVERVLPEKQRTPGLGAYQAIYQWVRRGQLPGAEYMDALAVALNTPGDYIMQLVGHARRERRALLPPPPAARRPREIPRASAAEIRAQAEAEVLRRLRSIPAFEEQVQAAIRARLQAQQQGLASRVGTEPLPSVPDVAAATDVAASEQEEARR